MQVDQLAARKGILCLLYCRWPNAQPDNASMVAKRIHTGISKILIVCNDDRFILLSPAI